MTMQEDKPLRVVMMADSLFTGAGRATERLATALVKSVSESELAISVVSRDKAASLPAPIEFTSWQPSPHRRALIKGFQEVANRHGSVNPNVHHSYPVFPTGGLGTLKSLRPDVVNLHWLGSRLLSIPEIGRIPFPVVWTLHDEWFYRGSEHYGSDERPYTGYPQTKPERLGLFDVDRFIWQLKKNNWHTPMTFVTPSKWLARNLKRSELGANHQVHVVPNALDLNFWKPAPRVDSARLLGVDPTKQFITMGAFDFDRSWLKGSDLALRAIDELGRIMPANRKDKVEFLLFGGQVLSPKVMNGFRVNFLGPLDDEQLRAAYSISDAQVLSSRLENFPQVATESIACGTPVVAFDVGGLREIVSTVEAGSIIHAFRVDEMAGAIKELLEAQSLVRPNKGAEIRRISDNWSQKIIAAQYLEVFRSRRGTTPPHEI